MPGHRRQHPCESSGGASRTPTVNSFPPPSEKLALQERTTIVCLIEGFFAEGIRATWLRNNETMATSENSIRPEGFFLYSKLLFSSQNFMGRDTLTCKVEKNMLPSLTSWKATDKDTGKPSASNKSLFRSRFQEAEEDSSVILGCIVEGPYPDSLSITWHENGRPLTGDNSDIHNSDEPDVFLNSSLEIDFDEWNSAKDFTCTISQQELEILHTRKSSEKTHGEE